MCVEPLFNGLKTGHSSHSRKSERTIKKVKKFLMSFIKIKSEIAGEHYGHLMWNQRQI